MFEQAEHWQRTDPPDTRCRASGDSDRTGGEGCKIPAASRVYTARIGLDPVPVGRHALWWAWGLLRNITRTTTVMPRRTGKENSGEKGGLLQGSLDLLVLGILASGPNHGFGISRRLSELSREWLQVDEGSLYPCLYRLEDRGYVRSEVLATENNRRARFYSITASGKEELATRATSWHRLNEVVSAVVRRRQKE